MFWYVLSNIFQLSMCTCVILQKKGNAGIIITRTYTHTRRSITTPYYAVPMVHRLTQMVNYTLFVAPPDDGNGIIFPIFDFYRTYWKIPFPFHGSRAYLFWYSSQTEACGKLQMTSTDIVYGSSNW